ncbi:MAG: hypothetical protein ACRCYS_06225, partial [Beijerinckiaceae bacterium]
MAANLKLVRTDAEEALAGAFDAALAADAGPSGKPSNLGAPSVIDARKKAMAAFLRDGLPNRRVEAWKYTDLRALLKRVPPLPPVKDSARFDAAKAVTPAIDLPGVPVLLSVDGTFLPEASTPKSVECVTLEH